jgi:hypothetical protein
MTGVNRIVGIVFVIFEVMVRTLYLMQRDFLRDYDPYLPIIDIKRTGSLWQSNLY